MTPTRLCAVHAHVGADAVTVKLALPPVASRFALAGDTENVQADAVNVCVIVTNWPATVSVPTRVAPVELAATENVTVPLPLPLAPPVTVMNASLLTALHWQPAAPDTATVPGPPALPIDCDVGVMVGGHVPVATTPPPTVSTTSFDATLVPQAFFAFTRTKYVPLPAVAVSDVVLP